MTREDGAVSTAFLRRLAERTRLRRWNRTRTVVAVLAAVTVVAVLAWVVLGSSVLATRTVEVRGVSGALADQVAARADDVVGTPLARVDLDEVRTSVQQVRGIGEVTVTREWPRTLRVVVVPRTPIASTRSAEGYLVLDKTGAVLETRAGRPDGLPVVLVGSGQGARVDDGLAVLAAAPAGVRSRTVRVDVRSGEDVRLTLRNGDVVRWGSTEDAARKAAVLAALLQQPASVYDVSAPDLPTTRR